MWIAVSSSVQLAHPCPNEEKCYVPSQNTCACPKKLHGVLVLALVPFALALFALSLPLLPFSFVLPFSLGKAILSFSFLIS